MIVRPAGKALETPNACKTRKASSQAIYSRLAPWFLASTAAFLWDPMRFGHTLSIRYVIIMRGRMKGFSHIIKGVFPMQSRMKNPVNAKNAGESIERILAVSAWRDTSNFTDAERAALALSESMTRLNEQSQPVPDEVYEEAARHYHEAAMATLIAGIATANLYNRINVSTRQVADVLVKK